ncbi:MAG: trypsin-like peptidase domain-containing protein [Lutibacter sp.]|nr:trypsin-like peptidase domain-containing protein [Lutibacter sp.]
MSHDPLSQTSFYLESYKNGKSLMSGTCFFAKNEDKTFLITNWHNVSGLNPKTKVFMGPFAVQPDQLAIKIFKNQEILELTDINIDLYDSDSKPVWLEHPIHKEKVDVVAIEVRIPDDKLIFCVEECIEPFNENTQIHVKDDVYVLGYPFGLNAGGIFPIWKRASIASEPIINIEALPKMYIDTASRPGMSGSPVIYKEKRSVMIGDGEPGKASKFSSYFMQFVGIYSGRITDGKENTAQLGIVWKYPVINEIIKQ